MTQRRSRTSFRSSIAYPSLQTCVIARVHFGHRASRSFSVPCPQKERCGTLGKKAASRPPLARRAPRTPVLKGKRHTALVQANERGHWDEPGLGSSLSACFRTRMDLSACGCPRLVAAVDFPVVRTAGPDMHRARPRPCAVVCPAPPRTRDPETSEPANLRTSVSRSTPRDHRCALFGTEAKAASEARFIHDLAHWPEPMPVCRLPFNGVRGARLASGGRGSGLLPSVPHRSFWGKEQE